MIVGEASVPSAQHQPYCAYIMSSRTILRYFCLFVAYDAYSFLFFFLSAGGRRRRRKSAPGRKKRAWAS